MFGGVFFDKDTRSAKNGRFTLGLDSPGPRMMYVELASLEIRMTRSENLPVLPQAVSNILRLADDPNASQRDLEKAFEKDPAIAAKILKVANSAYYGGANIPTIGRAISYLGISAIRSLVVGVAFQQVTKSRSDVDQFDKVDFWRHSLATAVASRILGKLQFPARSEELYCMGMLHDIGQLVLDRFMPEEFELALRMSSGQGLPLWMAERQVMGFDHAEVGGLLTRRWGLSDTMWSGIKHHHEPEEETASPEMSSIVCAAHALAYDAGFTNQGQSPDQIDHACLEAMELPEEQLPVITQVLCDEVEKTCETFNVAA